MGVVSQVKHNASPKEDCNLKIGVPIINIVDEKIDSIWWGWVMHPPLQGVFKTPRTQRETWSDSQACGDIGERAQMILM
jgi:hypothetical protein